MQPSWAALPVTRVPQTNSDEEQGEPSYHVSSELCNCLGVTESKFYEQKSKDCASFPTQKELCKKYECSWVRA